MTAVPAGTRPRTPGPALRALAPGRDEAVDALALTALTMIGIVGFRPAYGGHAYLAAGAAGVLLGLLLSHAGDRARLPLLAVVTASILAFLIFGGVVSGTGAVSLTALRAIAGAAVSGWQQLLTTARPVGRTAGLLALPYLLGLFSGVAGDALARRTAAVLLPAAAPALVVVLSILFGAAQPTAAVLQGAGFAALTLAWAAVRQQRGAGRRTTIGRQRPWQRIGAAAAVLAVAGGGAVLIGPRLPGAGDHGRVVLYVEPPFDVAAYPSPLAGYRDYTQVVPSSVSVYGKKLFATTGLPAGSRVRIAAMDSYDGLDWGVTNSAAGAAAFGGFQRVGTLLPGAIAGPGRAATITLEPAYALPWVPDVAGTTGLAFGGSGAAASGAASAAADSAAAAALRFNLATGTGILPGVATAGLRYTVSYAAAPAPTAAELAAATPDGAPSASVVVPPAVVTFAGTHAGSAASPMGKVLALAAYLRQNGRYSNGAGAQASVLAGHGVGRLTTFLESSTIVGDDEQYAATMALLANAVGVPARVSLDGTVTAGGAVYGQDVHADVELQTAQYGWVTLPYSQFTGTRNPQRQPRTTPPKPQPIKVSPPRQPVAAPVASANASNAVARTSAAPRSGPGFALPAIVIILATDAGLPLLAVLALAAGLVGAKALRRRRRRALGAPRARVAGAWRELTDLGRDLGIEPAGVAATRREQAARAEAGGLTRAGGVAIAADAAIFGPADPDDAAAAAVWALVEAARRGAIAPLPRRRRAWVAVNPASLWRPALSTSRQVLRTARGRLRGGGQGRQAVPRPPGPRPPGPRHPGIRRAVSRRAPR